MRYPHVFALPDSATLAGSDALSYRQLMNGVDGVSSSHMQGTPGSTGRYVAHRHVKGRELPGPATGIIVTADDKCDLDKRTARTHRKHSEATPRVRELE